MNYPQNEEEARKAIEWYDNFHSNGKPDLTINIERDINLDGCTEIIDIEFYRDVEYCHDAHVFIKRIFFETGAHEEDVILWPDIITIEYPDFMAAINSIEAYAAAIKPISKK